MADYLIFVFAQATYIYHSKSPLHSQSWLEIFYQNIEFWTKGNQLGFGLCYSNSSKVSCRKSILRINRWFPKGIYKNVTAYNQKCHLNAFVFNFVCEQIVFFLYEQDFFNLIESSLVKSSQSWLCFGIDINFVFLFIDCSEKFEVQNWETSRYELTQNNIDVKTFSNNRK